MIYERRPVNGNSAHTFLSTIFFVVLVGGGFWGFFSLLDTGDVRWGAIPLTAIFAAVWLWWRLVQHDARAFIEQERTRPQPFTQEPQEPITNFHVFSKPSFNGRQTAVGKFSFSRGQWEALTTAIAKSGYKIVRDPIREAKVFPIAEVKNNWSGIVGEFKRLNLIDDDQMLTPFGHEFFFDNDPFARDIDPPAPAAANGRH